MPQGPEDTSLTSPGEMDDPAPFADPMGKALPTLDQESFVCIFAINAV